MSLDVSLYIEVDTGGISKRNIELFEANITHNLGKMADEANIYYALWRPEEKGYKLAEDIIPVIEKGLAHMIERPDYYEKFNANNGWGTYEQFIPWIKEYLTACKENPKATIYVSR